MFSTSRPFLRVLALLLAVTGCSQAPQRPVSLARGDYRYVEEYLDWYIPQLMKQHHVPGVSIALVDGQKIVWARGFGYADREKAVRASAETVYQTGSISKVITATAVMQQVEQGRIDLDAPIQKYLPGFSMHSRWDASAAPTPRALLSHHAGLPTYYLKGFFSDQPLASLITELKPEHLAYPPGRVFNYSNLGPDLMGLVMENLSGVAFTEHMRASLLARLGMRHSSFAPEAETAALMARGYVDGQATEPVLIRDVPAGALASNVLDLGRFMQFALGDGSFDGQKVLGRDYLQAMFQPQYPDQPLDFGQRFGLGWMLSGISMREGGTVAWHNGSTKAFVSQMVVMPDKKLGVVVLANSNTAGPLVYDAAEQALKLALEARDGIHPATADAKPGVTLPTEVLQKYVGDYSLMGTLAHITRRNDRLQLHVLDHTLELVPESATEFHVEFRLLGLMSIRIPFPKLEFVRVEGRDFMLLRDRVVSAAEKIPPYAVPEIWRQRTGDYHIINPDEHYLVNLDHCRMLVEDGKLLLDIKISGLEDRRVKVVVVPLSDNEIYVFGVGRNVGDVARMESGGGKTRMWYSGYLFERRADEPPKPAALLAKTGS
jgi:CubicO group peptidase (beta-lactamase class C family)